MEIVELMIGFGKTLAEIGSTAFLIGLLIVLAVPKLKKKYFGNGEHYQPQINELKIHADVANKEMGEVKDKLTSLDTRFANVERDLSFIRGKLDV